MVGIIPTEHQSKKLLEAVFNRLSTQHLFSLTVDLIQQIFTVISILFFVDRVIKYG
jgi:hypothetical protein